MMKARKGLVEFFRILFLIFISISVISLCAGLCVYGFESLTMAEKTDILSIILIVMMSSLAIALWLKSIIVKPLKNILMESISHDIRDFKFVPDAGLPLHLFHASGFIKNYNEYISNNSIIGKVHNGKNFIISEILVKQVIVGEDNARSETLLFDGIFGVLDAKKINTFYLDITPDFRNKFANKVVSDFKKMLGNKDVVRLENPEFERYFEVYSDNQIEARKVITLEFMEKLLEVRKNMGQNITIIYVGNKIFFFIQHGVIANTRSLLLHGVSKKLVKETSDKINNICEAVELL